MKKKILKIVAPILFALIILVIICVIIFKSRSPEKVSKENEEQLAIDEKEISEELVVLENEETSENEEVTEEKEDSNEEINEEEIVNDDNSYVNLDSWMTLNDLANKVAANYDNVTRIEYGESYLGRPLEAYLINGNGSNSKTIFIELEVHGFEDEYYRDGKLLVELGNNLVNYYAGNPDNLGEYRMIIVPSANPDGVIEGVNNTRRGNGYCFGRCTAGGIDINRDFRDGYFVARESRYLKALMDEYKMNIHLDFHGWENSVIGDQTIVNTFISELGLAYNKSNRWGSGQGYVIEFTKNNYGAHSAIIEFANSSSVNVYQVENALNRIMKELN